MKNIREINFGVLVIGAICVVASMFLGPIPFVIGAIFIVIGVAWGVYRFVGSDMDQGNVCLIAGVATVIMLCAVGVQSIKQIDAGNVAIVINSPNEDMKGETFTNGWYFNPLFITSNVETIRYNTQVIEYAGFDNSDDVVGSITGISKDLQTIFMDVAIAYNIKESDVKNMRYTFGEDWRGIIDQVIRSEPRKVCSSYEAEELMKRTRIEGATSKNLEKEMFDAVVSEFKAKKFPINVVGIYVREIRVPDEFAKSIEQKLVAEQMKEKAKIDAERIEIEAKALAVRLQEEAIGEAEAMKTIADAKAYAINILLKEFLDEASDGDVALQMMLAKLYIDALVDPNSNITFVIVGDGAGGYVVVPQLP